MTRSALIILALFALVTTGCEKEQSTPQAPEQQAAAPAAPAQEQPPVQAETPPPAAVEKTEAAPAPAVKPAPVPSPAPKATAPVATPAPKQATPAATVTYKASYGLVTFDHAGHAGRLECSACHPTAPPVKIALDKESAHKLCKGCHQEKGAGPTQCTGCHKK